MNQTSRYGELDALRGIAALMVVIFHFIWGRPDDAHFNFNIGNMGVELFFIISGFVIFMSLSKIESGTEFIINRFTRLYPTYWACLSLTFILINIYYHYTIIDFPKLHVSDYLANLTMFQFFIGFPNVDESYWTLSIELLFYILMFLFYKLKLLKHILSIGLAMVLILVLLNQFYWNTSLQLIFRYVPLFSYFPLFYAGILFYKLFSSDKSRAKYFSLIVLAFCSQYLLFNTTGRIIFFSAQTYAVVLFIFMIVFSLIAIKKMSFITFKPLLFLGKISFALYLLHTFISVNLLFPFLVDYLHFNYWLSAFFIVLPVLIILSAGVTYVIEIPAQKSLKTLLKQKLIPGQ